jgi:hypothetical protein
VANSTRPLHDCGGKEKGKKEKEKEKIGSKRVK